MKTSNKLVIYQVLTRLFGNNNPTKKWNGSIEENGCGKMSAFTAKALKEIKNMGFTHIWYTGLLEHATQTNYRQYGIHKDHPAVVKGKAGSPYAIKDYYDIDPDLAENPENRMQEFEDLVARTRKAGMKIIIDFVPNHVAREYRSDAKPKRIVDLGAKDNTHTSFDPNNNFYYMPGQVFAPQFPLLEGGMTYHEYPAKVTGNDCFSPHPSVNDWYETIKLNYGVDYLSGGRTYFNPIPDTWHKMLDILLFWAEKGIDGFRCDMAEMVPVEFWNWAISQVKEQHPGIVFTAEVYNPDQYRDYIYQGKFDYLYDKVCLYDILRAVVAGNMSARAITSCWQSVDDIQGHMLNFLENHDEQRIASDFFAGNGQKAIPALYVSLLMNKNPFLLYFGQELGERGMDEEGFSGLDGRTTIFDYWSIDSIRNWYDGGTFSGKGLTDEQKQLRKQYVDLLKFANKSKTISEGGFYDVMYVNFNNPQFNPDKQFAFLRYHKGEMLLIVANFSPNEEDLNVFIPPHAFQYFKTDAHTGGYHCPVQVKAHSGTVIQIPLDLGTEI